MDVKHFMCKNFFGGHQRIYNADEFPSMEKKRFWRFSERDILM